MIVPVILTTCVHLDAWAVLSQDYIMKIATLKDEGELDRIDSTRATVLDGVGQKSTQKSRFVGYFLKCIKSNYRTTFEIHGYHSKILV